GQWPESRIIRARDSRRDTLASRAPNADDARVPWHLRTMKGLNPTASDERAEEVRKNVEDKHGALLEGFWLSEDDRTAYALIDADDRAIRAIDQDLRTGKLKKIKAKK
ncbi:MAG: hypothetical protein M3312_02320, partial [Actinomycetota bacterium]|nr:hypothetical protein [Actinomycetota bacterium]